jgi:hypothetical protein
VPCLHVKKKIGKEIGCSLPKSINQTGQQQCSPEAAHRFMQNSNNILMDLGTDSVLLFKAAHRRGLSINMIAIKIKIIKKKGKRKIT